MMNKTGELNTKHTRCDKCACAADAIHGDKALCCEHKSDIMQKSADNDTLLKSSAPNLAPQHG